MHLKNYTNECRVINPARAAKRHKAEANMVLRDKKRPALRAYGPALRCLLLLGGAVSPFAARAQVSLPQQSPAFAGVAEEDHARSTPDWPKLVAAPKSAPNVLLVLLDDVGFGATSITGGPVSAPAKTFLHLFRHRRHA
jgi:hypothetical protein